MDIPINDKLFNEFKQSKDKAEFIKKCKRQYEIDQRYLRMARIWSENSYAVRRKVGALLVKDRRIISDGYNGTPSGFPNICEYVVNEPDILFPHSKLVEFNKQGVALKTYNFVLHAEANAITKIAKSNNSAQDSTLYVTTSPCIDCAKLIIQSGITRVVFEDDYHCDMGTNLLRKANIEIDCISTTTKFEDTNFYKMIMQDECNA